MKPPAPGALLRRRDAAALAALAWLAVPARAAPAPVTVAAAADLKFALDEIAAGFERSSGVVLRISYGSSGNFYRQIAQDAPFELFLSADEDFIQRLAAAGRLLDAGTPYAIGRLALFAPAASPLRVEAGLAGLGEALADGRVRRLAIANPEHAPYGRAARQALEAAGLWAAAQPHLVLGENAAQAAQFAVAGAAQAGLIAWSLALAPPVARAGRAALLPDALHAPLRQRMALTRKAGADARAFHAYLQQPVARALFRRHGFTLPGEAG